MSFVVAVPELLGTAATDLASLGSTISSAHAAAAAPTTGVLAAAGDEVSAAIAAVFSAHGQGFQALGAQATAFHEQFVQQLNASAHSYASAEAANASLLRPLNASAASQSLIISTVLFLESLPVVGNLFTGLFGLLGISLFLLFLGSIYILVLLGDSLAQFGL